MKFSNAVIAVIIALLIFCAGLFSGRRNTMPVIEYLTDTLTVRDTVRDTVPVPFSVYINRVDTAWLTAAADTTQVPVEVPIERKEYETGYYRAVVEGYRANLLGMEVYPETRIITKTETLTVKKNRQWGIGIQAGYGIAGNRLSPYIGVGVQWNLIGF